MAKRSSRPEKTDDPAVEVKRLRDQNRRLRHQIQDLKKLLGTSARLADIPEGECTTVSVPSSFSPIFARAQRYVKRYFQAKTESPEQGTIDVRGERYLLVRAASMSKEFYETVFSHYRDRGEEEARRVATGLLFDFAHSVGKADARSFHRKMRVKDPIQKLSAGPVHFAFTGWASVEILPESRPSPDDDYYLIYDHPFSFEADVWRHQGRTTDFPVCIMNSGYSSGWCEESFGIPLVAVELECRAKGDPRCRFIMAPPKRIEAYIRDYQTHPYDGLASDKVEVPEFFKRKRLEDEVRRSEETARALLDAPPESALLLSRDGIILSLNETAARRLGKPMGDLIGNNVFDLFEKRIRDRRLKYHQQVLRSRMPVSYTDRRDRLWLDTRVYPILDRKGGVARVAVYSQDISEFKRNEQELERHRDHLRELVAEQTSELREKNRLLTREAARREQMQKALQEETERLAVTLASIADGVVVTDMKDTITLINKAAHRYAHGEEGAAGRRFDEVFRAFAAGDTQGTPRGMRDLQRAQRSRGGMREYTMIDAQDRTWHVKCSLSPLKNKSNRRIGTVLVLRDVTETKRLEEELLKHRKIESVGVLAGGIAHDFNNLLTAILGNVSLVKHGSGRKSPIFRQLEACENAALDARRLTQQLLTFSRGGDPVKKSIDLVPLLRDAVSFGLSGSKVIARFKFPRDVWPVELDEGQFRQVVHNLVINAVEAMPEGGHLEVRVENKRGAIPTVGDQRSQRHVAVSMADEGSGIADENLPKVFDPYFTTKKDGSGLGLTTAYSIMRRHQGDVTVDSEPGRGTVFTLWIPCTRARSRRGSNGTAGSRSQKRGRMLVMDDEEMVREVGRDILETLGYMVDTARTGQEAVEKYFVAKRRKRPYNLLIMDLTVPGGMGGQEALNTIKQRDPRVQAIVSSGYSNDPIMARYREHGFCGVIAKPYTIEDMKAVLDEVSDACRRRQGP